MKIEVLILLAVVVIISCTFCFKLLWLIRMGTLAHWSYLIGSALYPSDASGGCLLSVIIFGCFAIGSLMPSSLFSKLKFATTALSIPPQIHMLMLLFNELSRPIDNVTVMKSLQAYTVVTLMSTVWTIFSLFW